MLTLNIIMCLCWRSKATDTSRTAWGKVLLNVRKHKPCVLALKIAFQLTSHTCCIFSPPVHYFTQRWFGFLGHSLIQLCWKHTDATEKLRWDVFYLWNHNDRGNCISVWLWCACGGWGEYVCFHWWSHIIQCFLQVSSTNSTPDSVCSAHREAALWAAEHDVNGHKPLFLLPQKRIWVIQALKVSRLWGQNKPSGYMIHRHR